MLFSDDSKPYSGVSYHILELKSLTKYRYYIVKHHLHLKNFIILSLELFFMGNISNCHLTKLMDLLFKSSRGKCG